MADRVTRCVLIGVALALLGWTIVSYATYQTAWDDLYFLHRGVSLQRAVWNVDARQWAETFSILVKSPAMAILGVPWGPASRDAESVAGLAMFSLAVLNWSLILACVFVSMRMGVAPWLVLVAAAAVACDPLVAEMRGAFFADVPLSWAFLLLLLLIPYEAVTVDHGDGAGVWRGVLWGGVASVGLLAKVTFWPALVLAAPVILYLRWRKGGPRAVGVSLGAALIVAAPALVIVVHYRAQFIDFALGATSGAVAKYFHSPEQSFGFVLRIFWAATGAARYLIAGLAVAAVIRRRAAWPVGVAILILAMYGLRMTLSTMRDPRYFLPVAIGLPFLLALAASGSRVVRVPSWMFGAAFAAAVLISWPMHTRIDWRPSREARALLEFCRARDLHVVMLATDSREWNIETMRMGREMMGGSASSGVSVHTLAYSDVQGLPIARDFEAIEKSDAVVFESPTPAGASAINVRVAQYMNFVRDHGAELIYEHPPFAVFRVQGRLQRKIAALAADAKGSVSVACLLPGTTLNCDFNAHAHPPMQSVFKWPLAMTILHEVEQGRFALDQEVRFRASDRILPHVFSPLQDRYPKGEVDVPLRELLRLAVEQSDNVAADILLRLVGGPRTVDDYVKHVLASGFHLEDSEATLHREVRAQYRNWFEPAAAVRLLQLLSDGEGLNPEHTRMLLQWMRDTPRCPNRIKGLLPSGTVVMHKPGTSGVDDGVAHATNDVGLIVLPEGRKLAIAVFVTDSRADEAARDLVIARIAKAVYDEAVAASSRKD